MSVQSGLDFIARVRTDAVLRRAVADLGPDATFETLLALAADAGYALDEAQLREAHALDWRLRAVRYADPPTARRRRS